MEVICKIFSLAYFTSDPLFLAAASEISGIRRVESEFKRVEGKKRMGSAIPLIIPNCAREFLPLKDKRDFGTRIFSKVRSPILRYLPEVIGKAIRHTDRLIEKGGEILPLRLFNFFLSIENINTSKNNEAASDKVSPSKTAAQVTSSEIFANFFIRSNTTTILTSCSKSWEKALGYAFLRAIK